MEFRKKSKPLQRGSRFLPNGTCIVAFAGVVIRATKLTNRKELSAPQFWFSSCMRPFAACSNMTELFPVTLKLPEGFTYHENFLTPQEEQRLLDIVAGIEVAPMIFQGFEAKRKVASFGYDYSFDNKRLTKGKDIPRDLDWFVAKVAGHLSISATDFAELLVTEYPVGSVINWHRDAPPFDVVVGVSLLSDCTFKLRPHDKKKQTRKATIAFQVKRRSIYVMSGVSREEWQHCTNPVSEVRYSITLRTLKRK